MREVLPPEAGSDDASDADVVVLVVRSGGIAGMKRRWQVAPPPADERPWVELIERCPWNAPAPAPDAGADRFIWSIRARTPDAERSRELPESAVTGVWRELVDAVRTGETPS